MADENEPKGGAFNLINISTDALGLGKAVEKATPVGIEIVKAIASAFGTLYRPVATIAEGAARRHVRIQDIKAEVTLLAELGGKFDPQRATIIEGIVGPKVEETVAIAATKKPRKPRKPKQSQDIAVGLATSFEGPIDRMVARQERRSLRDRSRRLNEASELRWQQNIEATFLKAYDLSQESKATHARSIDQDFLAEWVDAVKNVSNEELQEIFAHILVEAPTLEEGRVEKAVVDFMKLLDPKMARLLKQIYLEGAISDWKMPVSRVAMDYITEEVGLASVKEYSRLSILDGTMLISAVDEGDSFELVQLSARARRIGEIVYGKLDAVAQAQGFFEDLPQWLSEVMVNNFLRTIQLSVTDTKSVTQFSISVKVGELLTVLPDFAPEHSQYVDGLDLGGAPYEAALKASMRKLAVAKKMKFDHAYSHAQYGMTPPHKVPGT